MNNKLVDYINESKARHIPLCRVKSSQHRLPWMRKAKLKTQRTEKWRKWKRFKESGLPRDYDAYKMERNRLNDMTCSAKIDYERGLIADMKSNQKSLPWTLPLVAQIQTGSGKSSE